MSGFYHNCGNNVELLIDHISKVEAAAYSFGNAIDIESTLKALPEDCMIMGNIDPAGTLRNGTPEQIRKEADYLIQTKKIRTLIFDFSQTEFMDRVQRLEM